MEVTNIYTAKGKPMPGGGGEHKDILTSGDRVKCFYYKILPNPDKDIMEGALAHPTEAVRFVISGELEMNVNGERVIMKKGDAMLKPYNAILGYKVISKTPAEVLIVACPDDSHLTGHTAL